MSLSGVDWVFAALIVIAAAGGFESGFVGLCFIVAGLTAIATDISRPGVVLDISALGGVLILLGLIVIAPHIIRSIRVIADWTAAHRALQEWERRAPEREELRKREEAPEKAKAEARQRWLADVVAGRSEDRFSVLFRPLLNDWEKPHLIYNDFDEVKMGHLIQISNQSGQSVGLDRAIGLPNYLAGLTDLFAPLICVGEPPRYSNLRDWTPFIARSQSFRIHGEM
jgi:hypothetical protein